jgi:cytochrome c biogenesis protein CcdA
MKKHSSIFQIIWALLAAISALGVLLDNLGYAAWNGINFVMGLYIGFSVVGFIGLIIGIFMASSQRAIFVWIIGLSAGVIGCLALMDLYGFVFHRAPELPLTQNMWLAGIPIPIIASDAFPVIACSMQILICIRRMKLLKTP